MTSKNMMTAKYDMGKMKALMALSEEMTERLCKLHGCEDEDDLPDAIQEIDFGGVDGIVDPKYASVDALYAVFTGAMPTADKGTLRDIAETTIKALNNM
mmetsp:Transcript_21064/g.62876  ORF Transcript_21064/g.62876 Transcript_21064/m.62876 type:complete len:99 (+) Transcript_21064:1230-1526(+)